MKRSLKLLGWLVVSGTAGGAPAQEGEEVDCDLPDVPLALFFQETAAGQVPVGEGGDIGDTLTVASAPGEPGDVTVWVAIRSRLEEHGVQGWSLAVAVEDGLVATYATTDGTVGAEVSDDPPGLRDGGYDNTELTSYCNPNDPKDPRPCYGDEGVVSAVVLSFQLPITLDPSGEATVLRIDAESEDPVSGDGSISGVIRGTDGLGRSQPIRNAATVQSSIRNFCAPDQQSLTVHFEAIRIGPFISGDSNGDGRLDVADPIYLLGNLFREGPAFPCEDAADANGDGAIDLSDATFAVRYLFLGEDSPTGLELGCATREESTPESCPYGSTQCGTSG